MTKYCINQFLKLVVLLTFSTQPVSLGPTILHIPAKNDHFPGPTCVGCGCNYYNCFAE